MYIRNQRLGAVLKRIRLRRGLSLSAAAARAGLNKSSLHGWEAGTRSLSAAGVTGLALVYEIKTEVLVLACLAAVYPALLSAEVIAAAAKIVQDDV